MSNLILQLVLLGVLLIWLGFGKAESKSYAAIVLGLVAAIVVLQVM